MSATLRGVVVWARKSDSKIRWHRSAKADAFDHAERFLSLETSPAQAKRLADELRRAPIITARAEDVLRAARREPLPRNDPGVEREAARARAGKPLRPALLVTLPDGVTEIADGEHRVSLAYHRSPTTPVAVIHAGAIPTHPQENKQMAKTKKTDTRSTSDVLEDALIGVDKAARASGADAAGLKRIRKAATNAQLEYLRQFNPRAAEAWEHERGLV